MQGAAATTLERRNTRPRPAVQISSSAALVAFVSPGQRGQTAANTYDTASVPPVAGDDPVNESDPSGLWTEGYCVGLSASVTVASGGINGCLVESNGNQQVGLTVTYGGGLGVSINASKWYAFLTDP